MDKLMYNKNRKNGFIKASKNGDIRKLKKLLDLGININIQDEYGHTALRFRPGGKTGGGGEPVSVRTGRTAIPAGGRIGSGPRRRPQNRNTAI